MRCRLLLVPFVVQLHDQLLDGSSYHCISYLFHAFFKPPPTSYLSNSNDPAEQKTNDARFLGFKIIKNTKVPVVFGETMLVKGVNISSYVKKAWLTSCK